jgi:hypothetical protein
MAEEIVVFGDVVSTTVIVNRPVEVFVEESITEQLTIVDPSGNMDPEDGEHVGVMLPSAKSDAVTKYVTGAPDAAVASAVMSDGKFSVGTVVSTTLISNDAVSVFP